MTPLLQSFAESVKQGLQDKGWSQEAASNFVDLHQVLARIENRVQSEEKNHA